MNPFDIIKSITLTKEDMFFGQDEAVGYNSYMVNKGLSYYPDCIFYANEMNMNYTLSGKMQYAYLLNKITKKSRFSKWIKPVQHDFREKIKKLYVCGDNKAEEIEKLLTKDQKEHIMKLFDTIS